MTSEVVVMNRLGVALASDSAATVYVNGRPKFYHADKLFMLSNHHPVGVMIYNNSSLLGVPWETILKLFRARLGRTEFSTLEEYAQELISFIGTAANLFPQDVQRIYYLGLVRTLFQGIRKGVDEAVLEMLVDDTDDGPAVVKQAQERVVSAALAEWKAKPDSAIKGLDADLAQQLTGMCSGEINQLVAKFFEFADATVVQSLSELARLVIYKDEILPESLSGVVIAGFGADQHFPVMQAFELGEIFLGKLKCKCIRTERVDAQTPSVVRPFAQSEMVDTFLYGASSELILKITSDIVQLILRLPEEVIDGMPGVGPAKKTAYKNSIRDNSANMARKFIRSLQEHRRNRYLDPIRRSIAYLPKNELAHVASSLVNLSSFQKRMSISEDETVGGPIDVAVISKGDGFVWIERKHYFRRELNRHFFQRSSQDPETQGDTSGKSKSKSEDGGE